MKFIIIGLMYLTTFSAFTATLTHENCRLNGAFHNNELNMILENKGYTLYVGKIEKNTLYLHINSGAREYDSHPFSVLACQAQDEKWARFTNYASIHRFDGTYFLKVAQGKTNYRACLQSGGEWKSERSMKRLLRSLPDCELEN